MKKGIYYYLAFIIFPITIALYLFIFKDERPVRIALITQKIHVAGGIQDYFRNYTNMKKSKYNWKIFYHPTKFS